MCRCKLCSSNLNYSAGNTREKIDVCELCIEDINDSLNRPHVFSDAEIKLRINLRNLRNNLLRIEHFDNDVHAVLESVQIEINTIERELGKLIPDYPSISDLISEYRTLLKMYNWYEET